MNINYYNPYVRDELYHHGIFGMKWGKKNGPPYPIGANGHSASENKAGWRKSISGGITKEERHINKVAKKDAKRYIDAKMYYGEGAGNRRKLLKGELDKKMKDPRYKEAFDKYVSEVDLSRSVNRAKAERTARDTAKKIKKTAGAVIPVAVFAGSVYYSMNKEKVDRAISNAFNSAINEVQRRKRNRDLDRFLKRGGFNFNM